MLCCVVLCYGRREKIREKGRQGRRGWGGGKREREGEREREGRRDRERDSTFRSPMVVETRPSSPVCMYYIILYYIIYQNIT
jgi:hypothetical protein